MKLLTIGIPTYNRAEKLRRLLETIIPQYSLLKDQIDILISDNCSSDATKIVVDDFIKDYKDIKYIRNDQNIGADHNFLNILEKADSHFIHIIGDDDVVLENSLEKETSFLKSHKSLDLAYCNLGFFRGNFIDKNHCESFWSPLTNDVITNDKKEFIAFTGMEITFLSGIIFSKAGFLTIPNPDSFCGTNWLQTYIAFSILKSERPNMGLISSPIVAQFMDDGPLHYDPYFTFGPSLKKLFKYACQKCGFNKSQLKKIYIKNAHKFYSYVSKDRIEHKSHFFKRFLPFFKSTCMYPSMWPRYLICLIPSWAWRLIRKLYKKISGKNIAYSK